MRIRSIKPEFWRSQDISALEVEDRLLFIGLWSYVDDNGVGEDRVSQVSADLFADDIERDPGETFARVSRGLARLSEAGRILRYEVEGRSYLRISGWAKHQRIDKPNKPRFPFENGEIERVFIEVATPSRDGSESVAPGTGEQGNRGTEEQGSRGGADADHPAPTCKKHPHWEHDNPCRACAKDRQAHEEARAREKQELEADARRLARRIPDFCPHGLPRHEACERCGPSWPGR